MPGVERQLVDLGARRGVGDRADAGGGGDLVDGSDHRQDGAGDVGERHEPVLDHEPALEHPVVGDELAQEVGERGPRPRDPSVGLEEPALAFAGEQRLAVVELEDEVELVAQRLHRVEQPKPGAAGPRR